MDRLPIDSSSLTVPSTIYPIAASLVRHTLFSCKPDYSANVPFTCMEMAHAWEPSCFKSALHLFIGCFKEGINIYGLLYTVTALLRRRSFRYFLTKLPHETIRSTTFLAANCFFFLAFFCLGRKIFGRISYGGLLLTNIPACLLSILIERKQRRGLLALYLANLATETAFNMAVDRNWLPSVNNGQVLLFSLVSAVYVYLFRTKSLDGSLFNMLKIFLGSEEVHDENKENKVKLNRKSRVVKYYGFVTEMIASSLNIFRQENAKHKNKFYLLMKSFEDKMDRFFDKLSLHHSGMKHPLCHHRYNCGIYALNGFIERFLGGFLLQAGIKIASANIAIFKRPSLLKKILLSSANVELGLFFGCFNLIYRISSCLLRWVTNKNNKYNALIAGYLAGWSMVFYKSSSITLYMTFKLLEILWMLGVKSNKLPLFRSFDVVLYTIATAFILWVGVFEPHNIRGQYWKFLVRISSNKFAEVNRHILDVFGTKASTINRTFRPIYNSGLTVLNSHLK